MSVSDPILGVYSGLRVSGDSWRGPHDLGPGVPAMAWFRAATHIYIYARIMCVCMYLCPYIAILAQAQAQWSSVVVPLIRSRNGGAAKEGSDQGQRGQAGGGHWGRRSQGWWRRHEEGEACGR